MPRLLPAAARAVLIVGLGTLTGAARLGAADTPLDKSILIQRAMADARTYLTANQPREAVAALEQAVPHIDGNADFLTLLNQAYHDELKRLRLARTPDAARIAQVQEKLDLLARRTQANAPPAPAAESPTPADKVRRAVELFKQGEDQPMKYVEAAALFTDAMNNRAEMTQNQIAAWAYCRVRVAADKLNKAKGDPAVAAEVAAEVEDALKLAPDHAGLRRFSADVLGAVGRTAGVPPAPPEAGGTPAVPAAAAGWQALELGSFRIRHAGNRELAEAVAKKAEEHRTAIFARWSGPPAGAWQPACEIVLHPSASAFAEATRQPTEVTGHAHVKLEDSRAAERRIDLRADDPTLCDNALPRELTHVVLADLFPAQAPPRWAAEAMAVLAASPAEVERYLRTLPRCAQNGELVSVGSLLESKGLPKAEQFTAFAVGSVSLVDFLVRWKKEKAFTTFLRDCQRYGTESALKRQYGVNSPRQLEELWKQNVLGARGQ